MKRKVINYAVGTFVCLTMVMAPAALYQFVEASAQEHTGQVYIKETPAQYAEDFSDMQNETGMVGWDEVFITEGQLEPFKLKALETLASLQVSLPESFIFRDLGANVDEEKGLTLGLEWYNPGAFREYVQFYFTGVDAETGTGQISTVTTSKCYNMDLLQGFTEAGIRQFREKLDITIPDNFEPTAVVYWTDNEDNNLSSAVVIITWKDPMESQAFMNPSITGTGLFPDMVDYSVTFQQADLEKQEGQMTSISRGGVYATQRDQFHQLEDFTDSQIEAMEGTAREFGMDKGIYTGSLVSCRGFNLGAGVCGIMFEFDSEGKNAYDDTVRITVTTTGKVVGYTISL